MVTKSDPEKAIRIQSKPDIISLAQQLRGNIYGPAFYVEFVNWFGGWASKNPCFKTFMLNC